MEIVHFSSDYKLLGNLIADRPWSWLAGSTVVVLLCLTGLLNFRQEKNPLKLWVPPDSDFLRDTEWLMKNFGEGMRVQTLMMTGENILEPRALIKLNEATKRIFKAHGVMNGKAGGIVTWQDVCFKVPVIPGRTKRQANLMNESADSLLDEEPVENIETEDGFDIISLVPTGMYCGVYNAMEKSCYSKSLLDVWNFDDDVINGLTTENIIDNLNSVTVSPSLGHQMNYTELLGDVLRDDRGRIVGAKAVRTEWYLFVNFSNVDMDKIGNDVGTADWATEDLLTWENAFLKAARESSEDLRTVESNATAGTDEDLAFWYEAARSFGDVSSSTMFQDIGKVAMGVVLMSFYVQIILSRLNWVEWRVSIDRILAGRTLRRYRTLNTTNFFLSQFCLTTAGLMCVGGAFIIAVGICSLAGVPYGPVHTSLPFMLMGLGVDDIFVMMAAWDQVHSEEINRKRPLPERIGTMLSHAGSSIFITSLTDVVAFVIGASTILPSLQSFCIYAAVGVFVTFLLQVTFFVGFFTLDTRRVEAKRNGVIPCVVHPDHRLFEKNEERLSWRFTGFVYSRGVLTGYGKIVVLIVTAGIAAFGIYGSTRLEQRFDPEWFLPEETYLSKYLAKSKEHYPNRGQDGFVLMGEFDYVTNFGKILSLSKKLKTLKILQSVDNWPIKFASFVRSNYYQDASNLTESSFNDYLSQFLFSQSGGKYTKNFRFEGNLTCGENVPKILISSIDFTFSTFSNPTEWIGAMDLMKEVSSKSEIDGFVTVWSKVFANWVTEKVISQEVTRNLILALICVMGTTAVLVAELQTCFWILICVLLTLVDICGLMYYWGLTIDIVSCIGLELAVGLSIDYAAHVAHAFLNSDVADINGDRTPRALSAVKHIGAAVVYGAGSTLLALSLLATSEAYVFRSFFKIFLLVVFIGLWHGLLFLPVILSTVGPKSLHDQSKKKRNTVRVADKKTDYLEAAELEPISAQPSDHLPPPQSSVDINEKSKISS
ncbi:NPC intracellular cholesterol transporter 1-like isoform X2 [Athalia rosae]|uniref:NPC intracellular cholesterol transporter 1-like isoform X2 n=1 Tax=Athalia rosae TaxID=37344 RepID=UPI0020335938|nr:NPC intracellular cholesterol transporter 1-like isoform X2 [Athalia rosae]